MSGTRNYAPRMSRLCHERRRVLHLCDALTRRAHAPWRSRNTPRTTPKPHPHNPSTPQNQKNFHPATRPRSAPARARRATSVPPRARRAHTPRSAPMRLRAHQHHRAETRMTSRFQRDHPRMRRSYDRRQRPNRARPPFPYTNHISRAQIPIAQPTRTPRTTSERHLS